MNVLAVGLQVLLGLGLVFLAAATLARRGPWAFTLLEAGRPAWSRWLGGGAAALLGALALATASVPFLTFFMATAAAVLLTGALLFQRQWALAGLLALAVGAGALRPLGLRVLALPTAAALPSQLGAARTLATFAPGSFLESVRLDARGNFFLSLNQGLDLTTGDNSHVVARIMRRTPSGRQQVWFELPAGATAGVLAFGVDSCLYCTGGGAARGVWRISRQGQGRLFATLPVGAWPNGLARGPDGYLYVADAALGTIWRIHPRTGRVNQALAHDLLRARPFVALAPGANGLHFYRHTLFVTVSDRGTILRMPWRAGGQLGSPTVFATGVPGDDFAIDSSGTLFVTTHPYNTVVRITPAGIRTVVAGAGEGIAGATDAAWGTRPGDGRSLYVVSDGGAFGGNPQARGALVQLRLRPELP